MRRTRLAEAAVSLLGVSVLVTLPMAGSGWASLLDEVVVTTTSSILPGPLESIATTVVDTVESVTPTSSTTTTVPPGQPQAAPTTTAPSDEPAPGSGPSVPAGRIDDGSMPAPSNPAVTLERGGRASASPISSSAVSPAAAPAAKVGALPIEAAIGAPSSPNEGAASPAAAGDESVHRELAEQLSVGGAYERSGGLRTTASLFDQLAALRLTPSQVARLVAPFPVSGRVTYSDDWGLARHGPGELTRSHEGVDVFADRGTPVIASSDGIVSRMTTDGRLGGVSLRLTAADGTFYYYAHLDGFAPRLADGERVAKGRVLGFAGNTGNAVGTPAHLHYEIHPRGGAAAPPVPYLDRWLAEAQASVATLAAAPVGSRPSVLRDELAQRAAQDRRTAADESASSGGDLGRIETISSSRSFGLVGLLVVLSAVAWSVRRWARSRGRQDVVGEGWTMVDLASLARPQTTDDEARVPELVGSE